MTENNPPPTKTIPLSQGMVALVDSEDYEILSKIKWYAKKGGRSYYAATRQPNSKAKLLMHRLVAKPPDDMYIDHINGNGLDNRKSNLRACTKQQNSWNITRLYRSNTSGFAGVTLDKRSGRWEARIGHKYKRIHVGTFDSPEEAAVARKNHLAKLPERLIHA